MSYERLTHYRATFDYKHEYAEPNDGVENGDIYNRLAELEDNLVEVPCKVGDTVYCVDDHIAEFDKVIGGWSLTVIGKISAVRLRDLQRAKSQVYRHRGWIRKFGDKR